MLNVLHPQTAAAYATSRATRTRSLSDGEHLEDAEQMQRKLGASCLTGSTRGAAYFDPKTAKLIFEVLARSSEELLNFSAEKPQVERARRVRKPPESALIDTKTAEKTRGAFVLVDR